MSQQIEKIKGSIQKLNDKDFNIYFFTMDSRGNPIASINTIYTWAKYLKEAGYKPVILHEKKEFTKPEKWMGKTEYSELDHKSAESKEVNMFPHDILIIPEIYSNVMEQTKKMPVKRIVLCQSYDYMLEFIKPGESWLNYGIKDCITTCESQKKYINYMFPTVDVDVINPSIPPYFKRPEKPKKPIFAIHAREPRNAMKIMKTFFLRFPQYRWVTFKDMRGINREDFAAGLKECCLAVWDDKQSGFGTFPLESFSCGTPLIATRPTIMPDWFDEKSAIWVNDSIDIPDAIGKFFSAWLEDLVPQEVMVSGQKYEGMYNSDNEKINVVKYFEEKVTERVAEFESAIKEIEKEISNQPLNNPNVINLFD